MSSSHWLMRGLPVARFALMNKMLNNLIIIDIRTGSCGGFQWPNYETQPCYTSGLLSRSTANCAVTTQRAAPAQPLVRGGGLIERPAAKLVQGPRPTPIGLLTIAVWNGCLQRGSVYSLEYAWAVYAIAPLSKKWAYPTSSIEWVAPFAKAKASVPLPIGNKHRIALHSTACMH